MFLVDKEIKKYGSSIITNAFDEKNIKSMSYDIHIDKIVNSENDNFSLLPMQSVIVKTVEEITVPNDMTISVGQKNSVIRLGLYVDAPRYFPGHKTFMFIRVMNLSDKTIQLNNGFNIAQLFFERLNEEPEISYSNQKGASFNNETEYLGYGEYKKHYDVLINDIDKVKDDIDGKANKIYANVLTLMGIFVAIFSLFTINGQYFNSNTLPIKGMIAINISMVFCVLVMLGLITCLINTKNEKKINYIIGTIIIAGVISIGYLLFP